MSIVNDMHAYHVSLAKSVRDPSRKARFERRAAALGVLREIRDLVHRFDMAQDGEVILSVHSTIAMQELLTRLLIIDGPPHANALQVEGAPTKPMRAVAVIGGPDTKARVLTDAIAAEDET